MSNPSIIIYLLVPRVVHRAFPIPQQTTKGMSTLCMSLPSKDMQYLDDTKDHNEEFVLKPDFSPAMKWNNLLLHSHRDRHLIRLVINFTTVGDFSSLFSCYGMK